VITNIYWLDRIASRGLWKKAVLWNYPTTSITINLTASLTSLRAAVRSSNLWPSRDSSRTRLSSSCRNASRVELEASTLVWLAMMRSPSSRTALAVFCWFTRSDCSICTATTTWYRNPVSKFTNLHVTITWACNEVDRNTTIQMCNSLMQDKLWTPNKHLSPYIINLCLALMLHSVSWLINTHDDDDDDVCCPTKYKLWN